MAIATTTRVLVVRSGPTDWDDAARLQGTTDMPVSRTGIEQVRRCIQILEGSRLGAVWCGPDEASVQTAELLAHTTGGVVSVADELADMNLGLWEGMLVSELTARFPKACKAWMDDPSLVNPPGGESVTEAYERLTGCVTRILERARAGAAIGFVLRPIALGMVRCWLADEPTCHVWDEAQKSAWSRWFDVRARSLARVGSAR
ncbi:MAG: histidine phosphatase family protein [Phycisphaerales bacterium]